MSIEFSCPACNKPYRLKDELAGKTARCGCGQQLKVPAPAMAPVTDLPHLLDEIDETPASEPLNRAKQTDLGDATRDARQSAGTPPAPVQGWLQNALSSIVKLAVGAVVGGACAGWAIARDHKMRAMSLSTHIFYVLGAAIIGMLAASLLLVHDAVRQRVDAGRRVPVVLRLLFANGVLSIVLWVVIAFAGAIGFAFLDAIKLGGGKLPAAPKAAKAGAAARKLHDARAGFQTQLIPNSFKPDGPAPTPPPTAFSRIRYKSDVGDLVAYITPDPGDGQRHPAVLWAHGGFGGIDSTFWKPALWDNDQSARAFRDAGIVLMCPSWRGENDNPGMFELFYGEVDDLLAAREHLASLPYVDADRIYIAGHSTGGTLALLAVTATDKFRAAFSFGGAPDLEKVVSDGQGYGNTPFDYKAQEEIYVRSAINFARAIRTPTFYFEGASSGYVDDARLMAKLATAEGNQFTAYIVEGGNHFNILQPVTRMLAGAIERDTGDQCNINFFPQQVNEQFRISHAEYRRARVDAAKELPILEVTTLAAKTGKEMLRARGLNLLQYALRVSLTMEGWSIKSEPIVGSTNFTPIEKDGLRVHVEVQCLEEINGHLMDYDAQVCDFVFTDRISQILLESQMR